MDFIISWLKEKTVLMPRHQLHFLHHADYIVALEDSTIREQGTFSDLMSAGGDFARLMQRSQRTRSRAATRRRGGWTDRARACWSCPRRTCCRCFRAQGR